MTIIVLLMALGQAIIAQPQITSLPSTPYITIEGSFQFLEFDFIITGDKGGKYELDKIEMTVYDKDGQPQSRHKMADEGMVSSFNAIPNTKVKGAKSISVYNPFYFFENTTTLDQLEYRFYFKQGKKEPVVTIMVSPIVYDQQTELRMPIKDPLIIDSGFDHYAHHRRLNTTHWAMRMLKIQKNITRYALDMAPLNAQGKMYSGQGKKPEDYKGFGQDVLAPASGKIIEIAKGHPDNGINTGPPYGLFKFIKNPKLASGNYVVIDHLNGEVSLLAHLKHGSISVEKGQMVNTGDLIGQIGNSGDSTYPHLHYQLENEHTTNVNVYPPKFFGIETLNSRKVIGPVYINTGDVVK